MKVNLTEQEILTLLAVLEDLRKPNRREKKLYKKLYGFIF
jgi:hypothetical protein